MYNNLEEFMKRSDVVKLVNFIQNMLKTGYSKNVTIEDWNTLLTQVTDIINHENYDYEAFNKIVQDFNAIASEDTVLRGLIENVNTALLSHKNLNVPTSGETVTTENDPHKVVVAVLSYIATHNGDTTAHPAIRTSITDSINIHNMNAGAHPAIQEKISNDIHTHNTERRPHTNIIGTGNLSTTSKNLIGAVNEANGTAEAADILSRQNATKILAMEAQVSNMAKSYAVADFNTFLRFIHGEIPITFTTVTPNDTSIYVDDLNTGDNILIIEEDVADFWFEKTSTPTVNSTYVYNGVTYSLKCQNAETATVGQMYVLETDYNVINDAVLSAGQSAQNAAESARLAADKATNILDETEQIKTDLTLKQNSADAVGRKTVEGGEIFGDYTQNQAKGEFSHAEGLNTVAQGTESHAEGDRAFAEGNTSHAEGQETHAIGHQAHVEGYMTVAEGSNTHAEGAWTKAKEYDSHSEGARTYARGKRAHAEGDRTLSFGRGAHSEGFSDVEYTGIFENGEEVKTPEDITTLWQSSKTTLAAGDGSHAEGINTLSLIGGSHSEGMETQALKGQSHAEGFHTIASGNNSHSEGNGTIAKDSSAHAEGNGTIAGGKFSHAEGFQSKTAENIEAPHAEGKLTESNGNASHSEGQETKANKAQSHAEGFQTTADGNNSHAEGNGTTTSASSAHAEGRSTVAGGLGSHAEGIGTEAFGEACHAEGWHTTASKGSAHAEGNNTLAYGSYSHAEGRETAAYGICSHAEGMGTIALEDASHVCGQYNVRDTENEYIVIIGNGTSDTNRSNAYTLDWEGNAEYAGEVKSKKATTDTSPDTAYTTKDFVLAKIAEGGGGGEIPLATETTVGGIKAPVATSAMTQNIGIAADGSLKTLPANIITVTDNPDGTVNLDIS